MPDAKLYRLRYCGAANNATEGAELFVQADDISTLLSEFPRYGPGGGWVYEQIAVMTTDQVIAHKRRLMQR